MLTSNVYTINDYNDYTYLMYRINIPDVGYTLSCSHLLHLQMVDFFVQDCVA